MITIVLVDDHAIVREGFKLLISREGDLDVVGECERPSEALRLASELKPHLVVIDLNLPEGGGFSLIPKLRSGLPEARLLVLSMHDNPGIVGKAMDSGVHGYITKAAAANELIPGIRAVLSGQVFVSSDIRLARQRHRAPSLSAREREVLELLAGGMPAKGAAVQLGISDKTLYFHRSNLMQKLDARNDIDLRRRAVELGLVEGLQNF